MKRLIYSALAIVVLIAAFVPASLRLAATQDLARYDYDALSPADKGIVTFTVSDWGGLDAATLRTNAVAWKLAETALALEAAKGDANLARTLPLRDIFRPFGFHVPSGVANWPDMVPRPEMNRPLGLVRAQSGGFTPLSVEIANMGCAACHSSVVYDADGAPDLSQVWLGGTNASLNIAAYTNALFDGLLSYGADTDAFMDTVAARFPDMSLREQATLRYAVLPLLMAEVRDRQANLGALLPFAPSHVGATNGYDSLRLRLGLIDLDTVVAQSYFTSIPALGGRTWRGRFLSTGVYTSPGLDHSAPVNTASLTPDRRDAQARIIAYFLLPSMGVTDAVAMEQHRSARDVTAWLEIYTPQPFPGPIDTVKAAQGQRVYAAQCAACHGTYDASLTRPQMQTFPNWEGDVGTHAGPMLAQTTAIANAINASPYAPYLAARPSQMRSAPPLTGLWASAPYLSNGSVPTLWHLMRPALRPRMFPVGGHRLDLARVGIDLSPPRDYVPWSTPAIFDTSREGFTHAGHFVGFDRLTEADKDALLEYLKLL